MGPGDAAARFDVFAVVTGADQAPGQRLIAALAAEPPSGAAAAGPRPIRW